jgi:hypothetical protein
MAGTPTAAQVAAELRMAGLSPDSYGMGLPALQAATAPVSNKPSRNPWSVVGALWRPEAWLPKSQRG